MQTVKKPNIKRRHLMIATLLATSLTACQGPEPTSQITPAASAISATSSPDVPVVIVGAKPAEKPSSTPAATAGQASPTGTPVSSAPISDSTRIKLPVPHPVKVSTGKFTSMSFQLSASPVTVPLGQQLCLTTLALNETGQILQNVTTNPSWLSRQQGVASVDDQGCVTALAPGETQIQASAKDKPGISATINVRVPAANATAPAHAQGFDFNGDGQRDWLIGYGSQYRLFLGDGGPLPVEALKPENMAIFQFPNVNEIKVEERLFPTQTVTGDLNGDGYDDIAIGHKFGVKTGEVAIVFGNPYPLKYYNLLAPDVSIPPAPKTRLSANAVMQISYDRIGKKLAIADMDHDGIQDLLIANPGYQKKGAVHIFRGRKTWPAGLKVEDADFQLVRSREEQADQYHGFAISFVTGDFNGDGWVDAAIGEGAPSGKVSNVLDLTNPDEREENRKGKVHVFLGGAGAWRNKTDLEADYRVMGKIQTVIDGPSSSTVELSTQTIGQGLESADLDGDGKDELLVRVAHIFQFAFRGPNGTYSPPSADAFKERLRVYRGQNRPAGSVLNMDEYDGGIDEAGYNFYDDQIFSEDLNHDGVKDFYGYELVPTATQKNFYGYEQPIHPDREALHFYDGKSLLGATAIKPTGMLTLRRNLGDDAKHAGIAPAFDGGPGSELLFYDDLHKDGKTCFLVTGLPSGPVEFSALSRRFCLP